MDGEGPPTLAFWFSRMCEEFDLTPTQVLEEEARLPDGLLGDIVEARGYAATKAAYDAEMSKGKKRSPLWALVEEITFDLAKEAIDAAKQTP